MISRIKEINPEIVRTIENTLKPTGLGGKILATNVVTDTDLYTAIDKIKPSLPLPTEKTKGLRYYLEENQKNEQTKSRNKNKISFLSARAESKQKQIIFLFFM